VLNNGHGTKFTIDRKIFSSDIWYASPWKLKIWIYLIGNANHTDGEFMGVNIKRGQILRSYRTIAEDCAYKVGYRIKKPSIDTVRRICEDLTKELRTVQRTVHCGTLITILKYDELQSISKERTQRRTQELSYNDRTKTVHNNNVKNDKNVKNIKEKYKKEKEVFEFARQLYPGTKRGLDTEWEYFQRTVKDWRESLPLLADAIHAQITTKRRAQQAGEFSPEWKHFKSWLYNRYWELSEPVVQDAWERAKNG